MIRLHFVLFFGLIVFYKLINCSSMSLVNLNYEGRFSKIESFPGFETLDALESLIKYNNTVSIGGRAFNCDLLCKVKAASSAVIVPSSEETVSQVEPFWLKQKLLKDFNKIPIKAFTSNSIIFDATMRMIEYNLFYRIEEYNRLLTKVVDYYSAGVEVHPFPFLERAWSPILKPVHLILEKLVRSPKYVARIETSLIVALVQLISSPIDEESEMTSALIKFILLNNINLGNSIVSELDEILERGIRGDLPIIIIEPILKFIGEILFSFRNDRESPLTVKLIGVVKDRIIRLYAHSKLHWFLESYSNALVEYFCTFEVLSHKRIERTPFDPVFPQDNPFQESETVVLMRRALLRNNFIGLSPTTDRLNQLSRFEVMKNLISHQFYPRYMAPEIFEAFRNDFVVNTGVESGLNLFVLLAKSEIYSGGDEVSSAIRKNISTLKPTLENCKKLSNEIKTICHRISEQVEIISHQVDSPLEKIATIKKSVLYS